jgi:Cysteine dioxygenase type I
MTNILDHSVETEKVLKANLCQFLETLQKQPLTLPLLILMWLLPKDPTKLEKLLQYSTNRYFWMPIVATPFGEFLLCFWSKNSESRRHGHSQSLAFVIVLVGEIIHKLIHISANKFFLREQQTLKEMGVGVIAGHQVHRVQNLSQNWAISIHLYFPRRKSIELPIDED